MQTVGIRHLKAHLSACVKRVAAGERLTVTDRGRAVAGQADVTDGAGRSQVTVYLDTSVPVKLYKNERDSNDVHQVVNQAVVVVTSVVAYAEARAAFARRRRGGLMTAAEAQAAVRQLDLDWPRLVRIPLDDGLARLAGRLAETHALRGYDAVHLASFQALIERCGDDDVQFSSADDRLATAARALG